MTRKNWTLSELAKYLDVSMQGDGATQVNHLATLSNAGLGGLSFLANPLYQNQLETTAASIVIIKPALLKECPVAALVVDDPYLQYAKLSHLFDHRTPTETGIHIGAVVHESVVLGRDCRIGANVVIGAGCRIEDGVEIGAGCVIGADCQIGVGSLLHANVTLYHGVMVGRRCTFHSGCVVGADGFGFAPNDGQWLKIAQVGGVTIGDDVDVGANTTIDRGAIEDTRIGSGVILDNQIQIAHNVEIGEGTAIAGCTGIAGSTKIGKYCTIAGAVGIAGHLTIADSVFITMRSAITKNITQAGSYSSGTAMSTTKKWRKNAARFRQLDDLAKRIQKLEKQLFHEQQDRPE